MQFSIKIFILFAVLAALSSVSADVSCLGGLEDVAVAIILLTLLLWKQFFSSTSFSKQFSLNSTIPLSVWPSAQIRQGAKIAKIDSITQRKNRKGEKVRKECQVRQIRRQLFAYFFSFRGAFHFANDKCSAVCGNRWTFLRTFFTTFHLFATFHLFDAYRKR